MTAQMYWNTSRSYVMEASQFDIPGEMFAELVGDSQNPVVQYIQESLLERERWLFVVLSMLVLETVFWICQLAYFLIDHYDLFPQYRIKMSQPYPSHEMVEKCTKEILIDHLIVRPILLFIIFPLVATRLGFGESLPSMSVVCKQFLLCVLIDDTWFYWAHRLAHHKSFYFLHKQHHEFAHPISIATEYASAVEDIFVNSGATVAGPLILGSHFSVFLLYTSAKLYQSIDAHSGYALPFPLSPWNIPAIGMDCGRAHWFHHGGYQKNNFGGFFRFWDWFMGTDDRYVAYLKGLNNKKDN